MITEGQIVLFTFPEVELRVGKLRPALILKQLPESTQDWLISMISTQLHQGVSGIDLLIQARLLLTQKRGEK